MCCLCFSSVGYQSHGRCLYAIESVSILPLSSRSLLILIRLVRTSWKLAGNGVNRKRASTVLMRSRRFLPLMTTMRPLMLRLLPFARSRMAQPLSSYSVSPRSWRGRLDPGSKHAEVPSARER